MSAKTLLRRFLSFDKQDHHSSNGHVLMSTYVGGYQHRLVITFRYRGRMLFDVSSRSNDGNSKYFVPVLLDIDIGSSVEEDLATLLKFLSDSYQLDPDKIMVSLHYNCMSLQPMASVTFSLCVVELSQADFDRLSSLFVPVSASKVLLERESNLFFDLIAREYLDTLGSL